MTITFDDLRIANITRLPLFKDKLGNIAHATFDGSDWQPSDWMNAIVGEIGELASELKYARRGDYGSMAKSAMQVRMHPSWTPDEVVQKIANEAADIVIYLDLLMHQFHIDLGEAVTRKFNATSAAQGIDVELRACED